jgi:hypothetical protein
VDERTNCCRTRSESGKELQDSVQHSAWSRLHIIPPLYPASGCRFCCSGPMAIIAL